jgi:hypothetical protein
MDTYSNESIAFSLFGASTWEFYPGPGSLPEQTLHLGPNNAVSTLDTFSSPIELSLSGSIDALKGDAAIPPKLGGRFSRETLKTLKTFLASHAHHPYPNADELDLLQIQTGLKKIQITNWFANARRRGITQARSAMPHAQATSTAPLDIPRPGTPAVTQNLRLMTPLERWVDSPPEHEPASVGAIAHAITRTSRAASYAQMDSSQSPYRTPSESSLGASNSSDASGLHSSGSQSSLNNMPCPPGRRRTRKQRRAKHKSIQNVAMPYQCTFCTETFRTKHDWQRHEKSLRE